ncbi:hypothetical protein [Nocardia farcinica]|uniref:hypothetical protein n=1 Tax=Nocardia farcinica TaxID=37329 RepID=UPI0024540C68|nr:hypothetical protein [Nocardia farcinica]
MAVRHSYLTYRDTYGFPVTLAGRQVMLRVGRIGVVVLPDALGAVVQHQLQPEQLAGPVFTDPRAGRWTFLLDGLPVVAPAHQLLLTDAGARILGRDEEIALPLLSESSSASGDERRWLWPPGYELPRPEGFLPELLTAVRRFDLRERARALCW